MKFYKILLGVTGGIAAYKSADLVRRLRESGHTVRVVMTNAAQQFITPLTMQALSGHPVYTELFAANESAAMAHIDLARWADLIVVAPASANFVARLAHGLADDLLATLCLAANVPLYIAPAMNQQMWLNPMTQSNIATLQNSNVKILGPGVGDQACGEVGPGRMLESYEIISHINELTTPQLLANRKVLVTAGPTREAIDPVRYLSNHSSGKMGYALAEAAAQLGAAVTLISGPTQLTVSNNIKRIDIETAQQMHQQVMANIKVQDVFIAAAAVCDYRVTDIAAQKIKKADKTLHLNLVENPDILAAVTALDNPPVTIGFAAETENIVVNAKQKLQRKNIDMIVANEVGQGKGFNVDKNSATIIFKSGDTKTLSLMSKVDLAQKIVRIVTDYVMDPSTRGDVVTARSG